MGRKSLLRVLWVVLTVFVALAPGVAPQSRAEAASVMDDNFDDNSLDASRWVTSVTGGGTVAEQRFWLEMTNPAGPTTGSAYAGVQSTCSVSGDFDVRVDYRLLTWAPRNGHTVRLAAADVPEGQLGQSGVYRASYNSEVYQFRSQVSDLVTNPPPQVETADRLGTLRLVRTGTALSGYHSSGTGFTLLGTAPTTTVPTRFTLDHSFPGATPPSAAGVAIAFDNFRVNAGSVQCPGASLIDDKFNDTALDASRWVTSVRDGGAVRQGLFLQMTNPAGPSYAGVQSTCSVSGDFDVRVDYRLLFWPPRNGHALRLTASDVPEGHLGQSGVYRASYNSEVYQFRSQVSDPVTNPPPQVETADRSSTLRLVRTGSTLAGYYGSGGAFTLLGTAPTTTAPTRFVLDLSFPDGAPPGPFRVAIAFDNFRVTGGTVQCVS